MFIYPKCSCTISAFTPSIIDIWHSSFRSPFLPPVSSGDFTWALARAIERVAIAVFPRNYTSAHFVSRYSAHVPSNLYQRKEEARIAKERKELAWQRDHAYDDIMTEDNLAESSNQDRDENFLDDFM
jgi:hypothetical protein